MMKILAVIVLALACLGECAFPDEERLGLRVAAMHRPVTGEPNKAVASPEVIAFAPRRPVAIVVAAPPPLPSPGPVRAAAGLRLDSAIVGTLPVSFHLEPGDRILQINGEPATTLEQLREAAAASIEGTAVEFQVVLAGTDEVASFVATR